MLTEKQFLQLVNIAKSTESQTRQTDESTAFVVLMRICRDYADPRSYPLLDGEARDKWLIKRLQKYQTKFFEKI